MSSSLRYRFGLSLAVALACLPLVHLGHGTPTTTTAAPKKLSTFKGKVVPLADVLAKSGIKLDAQAAPHWLALVSADGKTVYPLVRDPGAGPFFKDKALLKRDMQLTGRLVPGGLLQVSTLHSIVKGKLHEVYYWCDICTIKRPEKHICECCGGAMERREEPIESK